MINTSQENLACREKVGDEVSVSSIRTREYAFALFIEFLFFALGVCVYFYLTV